jgi:hypothetical protein
VAGFGQRLEPGELAVGPDARFEPFDADCIRQFPNGRLMVAGKDFNAEPGILQCGDRFACAGTQPLMEGEGRDEAPIP